MRWIGRGGQVIWFALLALVMIRVTEPITAYLTDADRADNPLIIGGNEIRILEDFEEPDQLVPGMSCTKTVQVENSGLSDCYVRIKAVFTDSAVGKYCSLDWNTADYVYQDGYYYYKHLLSEGEATSYLFTTVSVSGDLPADITEDCSLLVYAESCQAEGFSDYESAWNYWGRNQS